MNITNENYSSMINNKRNELEKLRNKYNNHSIL